MTGKKNHPVGFPWSHQKIQRIKKAVCEQTVGFLAQNHVHAMVCDVVCGLVFVGFIYNADRSHVRCRRWEWLGAPKSS